MRLDAIAPSSLLLVLSLPACSAAPRASDPLAVDVDDEPAAETLRSDSTPAYRDVEESFTTEDEQNRWFALQQGLLQGFNDVCGDTFCEGDFSNLQAMSFRCSVSRAGQLKSCLWLLAGSYESVTPSTGNIRPTAKFFACKIPVQGTPAAFMDALLAGTDGPLRQPLPGSTQTIYDVIGGCL